jgi:hypothetical protein
MADGSAVVGLLNKYVLWRLVTGQGKDEQGADLFKFEAWVNTIDDKTALFGELKPYVDQFGENIDWHECTHDESNPRSCVISETYTKSG